jgi:UDP-N-acetylglucosamine 1-carboxyvinyltransferase
MAEKFLIKGGWPLLGEVEISGSKNEAGAILAASLLAKECEIENFPLVSDILEEIEILKKIGGEIEWLGEKKIKIKAEKIDPTKIPVNLFEKIRISVLLVGPLLAKFQKFKIPHPGGDKIGLRPISTHLEAFKDLGVKIEEKGEFYYFEAPKRWKEKRIVLKEFSVTATENLMMLASLIPAKTKIENAATEPQVQNLARFLKKMGVKIEGIGSHQLLIEGKKRLFGEKFTVSSDPIEAGTFLIAFAITGGKGKIKNVKEEDLIFFLEKMKEIGVKFKIRNNEILVNPSKEFRATRIQVLPHPGFPTDLQPQTSVLLTQAQGKSLIHESLYENRFQHLQELRKMRADIEIVDPHRALIFGKTQLIGNKINSSDIRSGASLVLAGLIAKNQTTIENITQIERGYEKIEEKLKKLGAKIERI